MRQIYRAACVVTCILLGTLSWGQAAAPVSPGGQPVTASVATTPNQSAPAQPSGKSILAPDASVITISGLCDSPAKAISTGSSCRTVITRAEFEKIVAAIQPNMSARAKPEFANQYADALVMAQKAEELGLDKSPDFAEQLEIARIEILNRELKNLIRTEADQVSDKQIADYYRQNPASFEEADLERIYVPMIQASATTGSASDSAQHKQQSEQLTRELADQLRARALAGEDLTKLQQEAYDKAGIKSSANVSLAKVRRVSLPPNHATVMELQPGEVSAVLAANNGYYIYRLRSKGILSLEAAHDEIKGILRSQQILEETQKIEGSASSTLNEKYFYPGRNSQVVSQATR